LDGPGSTEFDTNIALICVKLRRFAPFLPVFFEPFQRFPPHIQTLKQIVSQVFMLFER
jgi:hypothetical protein